MVSRLVPLVAKMFPHKADAKFVVQDRESGLFLMPCEGDVAFTPWLHEAGRFDGYAEAVDTAVLHCHEGYFVTQIFQ